MFLSLILKKTSVETIAVQICGFEYLHWKQWTSITFSLKGAWFWIYASRRKDSITVYSVTIIQQTLHFAYCYRSLYHRKRKKPTVKAFFSIRLPCSLPPSPLHTLKPAQELKSSGQVSFIMSHCAWLCAHF